MVAKMTDIVREKRFVRFAGRGEDDALDVRRPGKISPGKLWKAINNDNVLECRKMESNSVDLVVTSIPFSNHYEYTPTYNDFRT